MASASSRKIVAGELRRANKNRSLIRKGAFGFLRLIIDLNRLLRTWSSGISLYRYIMTEHIFTDLTWIDLWSFLTDSSLLADLTYIFQWLELTWPNSQIGSISRLSSLHLLNITLPRFNDSTWPDKTFTNLIIFSLSPLHLLARLEQRILKNVVYL